jgi:hypothetical protein
LDDEQVREEFGRCKKLFISELSLHRNFQLVDLEKEEPSRFTSAEFPDFPIFHISSLSLPLSVEQCSCGPAKSMSKLCEKTNQQILDIFQQQPSLLVPSKLG